MNSTLPRTLEVLPHARVNEGLNVVVKLLVGQGASFNADDEVDVIHSEERMNDGLKKVQHKVKKK